MSKKSLSNKKFDSIKQDDAFRDATFGNTFYRGGANELAKAQSEKYRRNKK